MTAIRDLVDKARASAPEPLAEPQPPADPDTPKRPGYLNRLIEEARAFIENSWQDVPVLLGGEVVTVSIGMLNGDNWCTLKDAYPPETDQDRPYGYSRSAIARSYPAQRLKLNGEATDTDTWAEVYDLLTGEDPANVQSVIWGHHIGEPRARLAELRGGH